ncbi:MAG: extracellular solute-binding protein [Treponema sp.]|jgi:ABC-type glycerol-3-phosphate transport system substrate-binding protein|nr:extracellular solute-binding protein [Treponema sp.]
MHIITRKNALLFSALLGAAFLLFSGFSAAAYRKALHSVPQSEAFVERYYDYAGFLPRSSGEGILGAEFSEGLIWKAGIPPSPDETAEEQSAPAVSSEVSLVEFDVEVPQTGEYTLTVEYAPINESYEQNLFDLSVNQEKPDLETTNISLPVFYRFTTYRFAKNSKGNDIYPEQVMLRNRQRIVLRTGAQTYKTDPLKLTLNQGTNHVGLRMQEGAVTLYGIVLTKPGDPLPSYAEYRDLRPGPKGETGFIIEAERFYYKNKSAIGAVNNPSYTASPYTTLAVELNTIDPKTYKDHLDTLAYFVDIPQSGYYTIGLKTTMPGKTDSPVFLDIEIDGAIPFAEFKEAKLGFSRFMENHCFTEYPVYFEPGVHEIALVINGSRYQKASGKLRIVADEISDLSVGLRKITGNNQDPNREWIIEDFLPDMIPAMERWKKTMEEVEQELLILSEGKTTEEVNKLRVSLKQLEKLIKEPNKVPYRLTVLSEGERSILQTLSQAVLTITSQSLGLDQIIVGAESSGLPVVKPNVFFSLAETAVQLAASYQEKPGTKGDSQGIDVWVLRSRQYVDVLQSLTDEGFTPATGIRVNFSLITDQGKLTLANAAGRQPDAVLGVDHFYVNDLAVRGSLTDLRRFPHALDTIRQAAPGALVQMIIDDKLYGLPESQNLSLLYYRTDIFDAFGWKVPETWDEVLLMLPALARNGMNFYLPLAAASSFKAWDTTMPFYAQLGAKIYAEGARGTVIDSDEGIAAMKFMTNLFKIYGMPLQVASFYNDFRAGRIPIGISDIGEYARLSFSAPEIAGRWSVALMPGMANTQGEIERWSTCPNKADCIFEASPKKAEAWEFIRWWLSEETQQTYTEKLQNMYGQEFLWISGNVEALKQLPIPERHREQIVKQLGWLQDAPRIPGGYYTEREVSNAFNRIIYDGMDVRSSVDEASVVTNREIRRKLEEFGYLNPEGSVLREYVVPTIDGVRRWFRETEGMGL